MRDNKRRDDMKYNKEKKSELSEALEKDFHYGGVECDYKTSSNCSEEGCNEEGICRCSKIEDFKIEKVRLSEVAEEFIGLSEDEFTKYCIYRAVVACKLYEFNNWDAAWSRSYYGEEIDYIKIDSSVQKELGDIISSVLSAKTNKEKLFIVLEKEYGYVLPVLKEFDNFDIISVNPSKIIAGDRDHYNRLDKDVIDSYKDYHLLAIGVGVMHDDGEHIKLIDGYHRFAAKSDDGTVGIIVGD